MLNIDELRDFFDDPQRVERMQREMSERIDRRNLQLERIETMFSNEDEFRELLLKVVDKHNDSYIDSCYSKGYMPHPNNMLDAIIELAGIQGKLMEDGESILYNGFIFNSIYGQGVIYTISDSNNKLLLSI